MSAVDMLDAELGRAGRPVTRNGCIIARWRAKLDEDNQAAFDELLRRASSGEVSVQSLYRGLYARGMDASAASFDRHLARFCMCRHTPPSGDSQ